MVVTLIPSINLFFDKLLVMAEDDEVRRNRLALVGQFAKLSHGIADLSKLEGFQPSQARPANGWAFCWNDLPGKTV